MPTKTAIEFVFKADEMMSICQGAKSILITSYIEEVTTQGGQKVGALRVIAQGRSTLKAKGKALKDSTTIDGCPIPPCY